MTESLVLGLTGYPLEHSLSPRMHNAALRALGLEGEYRLFPVPPLPGGKEPLASLLERVRRGELRGLNVTIPHKQAVLPLLDELSAEARAIGAANTILLRGGRLAGLNTDAGGFLADLGRFLAEQDLTGSDSRLALVLGAGGSARAVVYALACAGWQVRVAARRLGQAQALCGSIRPFTARTQRQESAPRLQALLLEPSPALIDPAPHLIVNTTPVGMHPHPGASPWPAGLPFPIGAAVYDLVYNPAETALIQSARLAGLRTVNGLGMLLEQAALAFEHWTGRVAPREVMRQALWI